MNMTNSKTTRSTESTISHADASRRFAKNPVITKIERAIRRCGSGDALVGAKWEGLVAARKFALAELASNSGLSIRW